MKRIRSIFLFVLLTNTFLTHAEQVFPPPTWKDQPNPLASPDAEIGGEISIFVAQYPKSFNYYLENNVFAYQLFSLMFSTLLTIHPLSLENEPGLAKQWTISDNKRTFIFELDNRATWSDGKAVTPEDVLWTYKTIMDPKNLTGPHKVSLERFETPELVASNKISFTAKEVHWKNLLALGSFYILPKHAFEKIDFNKINFEFPVVSGLYQIQSIQEGQSVQLKRRDGWWNRTAERFKGTGNFATLDFRFYAERESAYEAFKKGNIDLLTVYTSHRWVQQTQGEKFDKNWIVKQAIYNYDPIGFQGFAMNLRRKPFDDINIRKALAHLLDREKMNETIMHNQYFLHRSYYEDLYGKKISCPNPIFNFDKDKARQLLKKAGWEANPKTGILEKGKRPFTITFLTRSATAEKFLVIYKEDLKDVGIQLEIDKKDWAAWARDMDEFNYDMTWAAWGASLWKDPESMWHSKEANRPSGSNITGFQDPRIDQLIEKQKELFDIEQRHAIVRKIDHLLTKQVPYILLWGINYTRLLSWDKFGTPDTVLSKYGNEGSAYTYWWFDPDSEADLKEAMKTDAPLPSKPYKVVFDNEFEE
ncbi:MAG: ABC transporter substrate-binding protein [Kiritimatiellae bacterium]|nr:ABC transporter substrate-binding protein [Kiritimatiellia bacterium]